MLRPYTQRRPRNEQHLQRHPEPQVARAIAFIGARLVIDMPEGGIDVGRNNEYKKDDQQHTGKFPYCRQL